MTTSYSRKMASLLTEQRNPRTMDIDRRSVREILEMIHREDHEALAAVGRSLGPVERAVGFVVEAFRRGGRLFYVGAGTSGRLGVLDAAECPPTFGTPRWMVQGIIAGGYAALHRSIEGAEDYAENGAAAVSEKEVCERDVVVGIAASSVTPFVLGALREGARRGARTVFLTCHASPDTPEEVDVTIQLLAGPEVLTGSTRMKAGTATKLVLNMITTTSMIRIGKVYQNLMVDLMATCNKLVDRAHRILVTLTDVTYEEAGALLTRAGMHVKTALVMQLCGVDRQEAERLLSRNDGLVYNSIRESEKDGTKEPPFAD